MNIFAKIFGSSNERTIRKLRKVVAKINALEPQFEKMKDDKSQKVYYLVNEKELDLPLGLRFLGSGTKADHLFVISETHEGVRSILSLTNPDIVSAVFTFVESLPESSMVYPRAEMIAYMEKTISEMPG